MGWESYDGRKWQKDAGVSVTKECSSGAAAASPPRCSGGHACVQSSYAKGAYGGGWKCNTCRKSKKGERWFCSKCQDDYCFGCHAPIPEARGGGAAVAWDATSQKGEGVHGSSCARTLQPGRDLRAGMRSAPFYAVCVPSRNRIPSVPETLRLESTTRKQTLAGLYHLVPDHQANGMPVW
eukprot:gene19660-biopygen23346